MCEGFLGFVYLLITIQSWASSVCLCVCVCACSPVHTRILERRRSAALCMMKPCIGYDFCLSDIHIHAWLSGRMYKIVAATLDSLSFWLEQAPSVAPTPSREGLLFLCVWTGLMKPPGCRWTAAAATGEPHSCGQCCYQGAECPHAAGVRCLWTCVAEKRWCHWNEQKGTMRMWSTCPIVLQWFFFPPSVKAMFFQSWSSESPVLPPCPNTPDSNNQLVIKLCWNQPVHLDQVCLEKRHV